MPAVLERESPQIKGKKDGVCRKIERARGGNQHNPIREAILEGDTDSQLRARLGELVECFGKSAVAAMVGMKVYHITGHLKGHLPPFPITKRLVWLLWSLRFEPGRLRTWFDVISWGKFCPEYVPPVKRRLRKVLGARKPPVVPWKSRDRKAVKDEVGVGSITVHGEGAKDA